MPVAICYGVKVNLIRSLLVDNYEITARLVVEEALPFIGKITVVVHEDEVSIVDWDRSEVDFVYSILLQIGLVFHYMLAPLLEGKD